MTAYVAENIADTEPFLLHVRMLPIVKRYVGQIPIKESRCGNKLVK